MTTFQVTIDVSDFVPDGVAPRLAFVTFSRLTVDDESGEIVTTSPVSVRVTQDPATVTLTAGATYKVRGDGISGVGTFYALAASNVSLAQLRDQHQIDPITQQPISDTPTVEAVLAGLQQQIDALPTTGSSGIAFDTDGVPYLSDVTGTAIQLDTDGVPYLTF